MTTLALFEKLLSDREHCLELGMKTEQRRKYLFRLGKLSEATMSRWLIKDGWEKEVVWRRKDGNTKK